MGTFKLGSLILAAGMSAMAQADDIRLGTPAYGGTGCPAGTASVTLSPDAKALSILFDNYVVQAGQSTGKSMDRKSCNVAIPVHIPQGYSVSVIGVDYRGFTSLPRGSRANFNVEYFFAGSRGPRVSKNFNGPSETDYLIRNDLVAEAVVWSACGADVNLRANTSLLVNANRQMDDSMATLDSADVEAGIVYQIQWKRCR